MMAKLFGHLFIYLLLLINESFAVTHWLVTENGRIQPQMNSVFSLKRPYDVVALMQQEKRAVLIEELQQQLIIQQEEIDRRKDKESNFESQIYASDEDCTAAEKPLAEFDMYASTVVPFPPYKELDEEFSKGKNSLEPNTELKKPNCSDVVNLDFSMLSYEHLTGVRDRNNISMSKEESLHSAITSLENLSVYGHLIHDALQKNKTSWILFTMASYYWRVLGNASNAIECVRRALHFSPREHKDVALISLGNILHHAHLSEEAAIAVHAAVDTAPDNPICHFTLGNIYSVIADYNKSAICYKNTLKVQSDFRVAEQRYHAVMCQQKLEKAMLAHQDFLQKTLTELEEYHKQHDYWSKQTELLLKEQATPQTTTLEQTVIEYRRQKYRENIDGRGMGHCSQGGDCCGMPILFTVVPP